MKHAYGLKHKIVAPFHVYVEKAYELHKSAQTFDIASLYSCEYDQAIFLLCQSLRDMVVSWV